MTPKEKDELRKQGFTEEEIATGNVKIFEHLIDPNYKPKLVTYLRLLDIIPIVEQEILNKTIDILDAKNIFKQLIKLNLNNISKQLDKVNVELYRAFDKKNKSESSKMDRDHWYRGYYDLALKFADSLVGFVEGIEIATNVSESVTKVEQEERLLEHATIIGKVKPGQIFVFADRSAYCEYTFVKREKCDNGLKYYFHNTDDSENKTIDFYEENCFRPVLIVDMLSEKNKKEVKELVSKLCNFINE